MYDGPVSLNLFHHILLLWADRFLTSTISLSAHPPISLRRKPTTLPLLLSRKTSVPHLQGTDDITCTTPSTRRTGKSGPASAGVREGGSVGITTTVVGGTIITHLKPFRVISMRRRGLRLLIWRIGWVYGIFPMTEEGHREGTCGGIRPWWKRGSSNLRAREGRGGNRPTS